MPTDALWERSLDLTNHIFQTSSGLDLPRGGHLPNLLAVSLSQSNQRLDSVRILLNQDDFDGAVILTRSLFELAVNMAYIYKSPIDRLPQYLKHGGIPTTEDEALRLQQEIDSGNHPSMKGAIPGQAWRRLRDMCDDLGPDWLKEYETFYRYASIPTHAGAFTIASTIKSLLDQQPPSDWEKAAALTTASAFHLRVAEIAAKTFPNEIDIEKIQGLRDECSLLGKEIANL